MVIQSASAVSRNMRVLYFVCTSYIILPIQLVRLDIINLDIGELQFKARVGTLPIKYYPMGERDQTATRRAMEVVDLIQLVPDIDPLNIPTLPPIAIDQPVVKLFADVLVKNFTGSGVKSVQLRGIEVRLSDLRTDLNVRIPDMRYAMNIKVQGNLCFIPLMFSCHISGHLTDVDVMISFGSQKVMQPEGEVLQITSAAIGLHLSNLRLNITQISFNGPREDFERITIQEFFSSAYSGGNLFDKMLLAGVKFANKQLLNVPMDLIESFLSSDDIM